MVRLCPFRFVLPGQQLCKPAAPLELALYFERRLRDCVKVEGAFQAAPFTSVLQCELVAKGPQPSAPY
jgi:hypothetical protein